MKTKDKVKLFMDENKTKYNIINIFVIITTFLLFIYEYKDIVFIINNVTWTSWLILTTAAVNVHIIKAGKLYLALYGNDIAFKEYIKTYCKVTPVSIILPFKIGELFRMYCYGNFIGNILKGIVIILLDRFMDTMALITSIILVCVIKNENIISVVDILFVFLTFILLIYFVYPSTYTFWKKYLLKSRASKRRLAVLKVLVTTNVIYNEIENVTKGRGIILYFLSLITWGVELGSLFILYAENGSDNLNQIMSRYLNSAISGSESVELKKFVIISVILLVIIYIYIKISEIIIRKEVRQ